MGGGRHDKRVTEYNPRTNTRRSMPSLNTSGGQYDGNVCAVDNKMFALGGGFDGTTCQMLDLSKDNSQSQWKHIARMNSEHRTGGAVVIENKIYVLGGRETCVEVYDVDQGSMMLKY